MTDNEIIKALEYCLSGKDYDTACMKCPIEPICESDDILLKYALDLINSQKAEIESLKHRKTELQIRNQELQHEKSEAIKEFIDELKNRVVNKYEYTDIRVFKEIDNLVKEMTEVEE